MAIPFVDAVIPQGLLSQNVTTTAVMRGSLVSFNYTYHRPGHDPAPMILVTDIWPNYIRGVNLHYLTFPVIKKLMFPSPGRSVCDSPIFSYQYIKGNRYITSAFRQYKRMGIERLRKLDCAFIVNAISMSRSFDPNEIEAIRRSVREQIRRMVNEQAQATAETTV